MLLVLKLPGSYSAVSLSGSAVAMRGIASATQKRT